MHTYIHTYIHVYTHICAVIEKTDTGTCQDGVQTPHGYFSDSSDSDWDSDTSKEPLLSIESSEYWTKQMYDANNQEMPFTFPFDHHVLYDTVMFENDTKASCEQVAKANAHANGQANAHANGQANAHGSTHTQMRKRLCKLRPRKTQCSCS